MKLPRLRGGVFIVTAVVVFVVVRDVAGNENAENIF